MPPPPRSARGARLLSCALLATASALTVPAVAHSWDRYLHALDGHDASRLSVLPFDALLVTLLPMSLLPWAVPTLRNASAITPGRPFWFTGANAASGLLVPVANLWWCHLILADIEGASRPGARDGSSNGRAWRMSLAATTVLAIPRFVVAREMRRHPSEYTNNIADAGLHTVQAILMVITAVLLALAMFRIARWQGAGAPAGGSPATPTPAEPLGSRRPAGRGPLLASASTPAVLLTLLCAIIPHWGVWVPAVVLWVGFVPLMWRTRMGPRIMLILLGAAYLWFVIAGVYALVPLLVTTISGLLAVRPILLELEEASATGARARADTLK